MMSSWWTQPMPAGWEAKWDANQNRYFFIDHSTKKTTWVDPRSPQGKQARAPQPPAPAAYQPQLPMQNMNPWSQYGGATQPKPATQSYGAGGSYSGYGTGSGYAGTTSPKTHQETSFVENSGTSRNAKLVNNALRELKEEMNLTDEQIQEFMADADDETLRDLGVKVDSASEPEEDFEEAKYSALIGKLRARYSDELPDDVITQVVYSYECNEDRIAEYFKKEGYLTKQEKNVKEARERELKRKQDELFRELKRKFPDIEASVVKMASQMESKSEATAMLDDIKRTMEESKRKQEEADRQARLRAEAEKKEREARAKRQAEEDDKLMKQLMEEDRENQLRIVEEIRRTEEELKRTQEAMKKAEKGKKTQKKETATKPSTSGSRGQSPAKTTISSKNKTKHAPPAKKSAPTPSTRAQSTPTPSKMKRSKPEWRGSGLANGPNKQLVHGPDQTLLGAKVIHAVGPSVHTYGPSQACGPNHTLAMGPSGIARGPMNQIRQHVLV